MTFPTLLSRRWLAICFVCVLLSPLTRADELPRADPDASGFSKEKLEAIPAALKKAVEEKKIAGGSALIAKKGKVVHLSTAGMQDIESKSPFRESTIVRIASMSKPITSVAVMILVEEGKIKVTDPLSKYVPEYKEMKVLVPSADGKSFETVAAKREITIHDLLTHSSGITYGLMNKPTLGQMYADAGIIDGLAETKLTIGDNVKKLAKLPLCCQPGSAWEYGLNTDVLGYVVEVASGKTLDEFLHERILKPLKMDDTYFVLPKEKRSRLASVYQPGADKTLTKLGEKPIVQGSTHVSVNYPVYDESKYYSGGAGLVSTIGDYFRFSQMMLNKGELNGVRVLKAETVETMTKNQLGDIHIMFPGFDLMGYGFGILSEKGKETNKDPAGAGSFSWGGAFGTFFWIDPKNELVCVLLVQAFPPDFTMGNEIKKLVYDAMK